MLKVKKATYFSHYKIKILFSDGKVKIVDFEQWIFENENDFYLKPLRDVEYFKKFDLDESGYTICWPNSAEFSPDTLYKKGRPIKKARKTLVRKPKKKSLK
jgi:hypothetical protein